MILYQLYSYIFVKLEGGRQFKITPNDLIVINQIQADVGDEIYLEKVTISFSSQQ